MNQVWACALRQTFFDARRQPRRVRRRHVRIDDEFRQPLREETFGLFDQSRFERPAWHKRRRHAMDDAEILLCHIIALVNAEDVRLEAGARRRPHVSADVTRPSAFSL